MTTVHLMPASPPHNFHVGGGASWGCVLQGRGRRGNYVHTFQATEGEGDVEVSPLEQLLLRDQSCSPPARVKSEPSERVGGAPGEGEAGGSQGVSHGHPYLGVQSYPSLAALSSNLGVVGLSSSSSSDLASISSPNPAGLVSVIMAATPPRPQRRASNPLNCPVCGRVVLFRSEFEKHMRTHTGEKPFLCHLCSYRSAQRSNLNVHLKSVHKLYLPSTSAAGSQPPPWNGNPDSRFIG
ncbi:zinc finger and BTB domain-containing protein 7B-like [Portunus trituberculatus]|uniref:zinc finger and BTB domain-containing protein 7B-like n=1 Tax=Portunus trituberculatus TaxID=210409 RepID=UPI001E1D08C5|nr:zinc finger and BTB domain-containing protein 7B-like [Portunus trituberculatus]